MADYQDWKERCTHYRLTEVNIAHPPRVCKAMLEKKLLGDRKDESTMSNRHKDWLVQEQTTLGKDFSNPFMADNLPKIVWLSTHHIYVCKELASPQGYGLCLNVVLYKSLPKHIALYEALEAYIERAQRDEFIAEQDKSRKRRNDDQDPHPPPPDSDLSNKK
ncbi:hypothetical protein Tco_0394887 [Tanacetum coccineum]